MSRSQPNRDVSLQAYQVEAPRAGDAIGQALRGAYDRDFSLPDDMTAILQRLNMATTRER